MVQCSLLVKMYQNIANPGSSWRVPYCCLRDLHVRVSRSQPDGSRLHLGSLAGLADTQRAATVQPLRQLAGKQLRHVLHNHHRHGEVLCQLGQHHLQSCWPAGRYADHHNLYLCSASPASRRRPRSRQTLRELRLRDLLSRRLSSNSRQHLEARSRKRGDLGQQLAGQRLHRHRKVALLAGLHHIVCRAHGERVQGGARAPLRIGAAHDHRQARLLQAQPLQHIQPMHARHLEVQHHHIGAQPDHRRQALHSVPHHAAQLHRRQIARVLLSVRLEERPQHAAHHRGVVHRQHSYRSRRSRMHGYCPFPCVLQLPLLLTQPGQSSPTSRAGSLA